MLLSDDVEMNPSVFGAPSQSRVVRFGLLGSISDNA